MSKLHIFQVPEVIRKLHVYTIEELERLEILDNVLEFLNQVYGPEEVVTEDNVLDYLNNLSLAVPDPVENMMYHIKHGESDETYDWQEYDKRVEP